MFFFFFLLTAFLLPEVNGQVKRCVETLYPSGCTLADCGQKCYERHQQISGQCIGNESMTNYACVCVWSC
ncbi:unnamed protein product [Linum tenue]|uniref:Uncharacterized protein n=1 Tax=Linum tenue TaxID=586396 RepID=A0AAV0J9N0_9ROSI|nr:unnamed protein product [Linum tenue]